MIGTFESGTRAPPGSIEELQVRLRHLENDFALTRSEYEDATSKYLTVLAEVQRKNAELEALRESLEARVLERTSLLASANRALEQEVAKQQRTEQALREAEARTRLLVEHLPVCLVAIGPDGAARLVLNAYARRVLGYGPETEGEAPRFADPAETPIETGAIIREASRRGVYDRECLLLRRDGRPVPVHLVVVPQRDGCGRVAAYYGFAEDITERRRAEEASRRHGEEMARAGKLIALGTLVAGVAHEMNNPNNLIMLSVPVLKKWFHQLLGLAAARDSDDEDRQELARMREDVPRLLASIEEGSRRLRDIVKDLRDFARPDDRDFDQPLNVNELVAAAVNLLQGPVRSAARRFEVAYGRDLPVLRGHPGQIRQLVISLVKNAYESLRGPDAWVRVATRFDAPRSEVVIEVEDNGSGIAPENIPHVCDPFFTTRREQGAMGLGLAIVAGMVRAHRGTLTFDSEPGRGTKVTVRLPVPARTGGLSQETPTT
jgi:PAS domain S-box-containing protein